MQWKFADTVVVLDFETTGLSLQYGDRAIEIGAVLVESLHAGIDNQNNTLHDEKTAYSTLPSLAPVGSSFRSW